MTSIAIKAVQDKQQRVAQALLDQIVLFPRSPRETCLKMYWPIPNSNVTRSCHLRRAHDGDCCGENRRFKFHADLRNQARLEELGSLYDLIVAHDCLALSGPCSLITNAWGSACEVVWSTHKLGYALIGEAYPEWVVRFS